MVNLVVAQTSSCARVAPVKPAVSVLPLATTAPFNVVLVPAAAATACLALLDTTLATGRRVGALLVRATAAAAGQQGAPGADWFQEACRILEDLEGLGSRSFETITAATQVVQPARSLPSLNTWRHVLTMLAAAALEALAWAQTLEAVVVLSPEELPHGLAEALLSPPGGYHAVDMLCCNFVVLLRELLPLLGQCSGRRSIDPLQASASGAGGRSSMRKHGVAGRQR